MLGICGFGLLGLLDFEVFGFCAFLYFRSLEFGLFGFFLVLSAFRILVFWGLRVFVLLRFLEF